MGWLVLVFGCVFLLSVHGYNYRSRTENNVDEQNNRIDLLDQYVEHVDQGRRQQVNQKEALTARLEAEQNAKGNPSRHRNLNNAKLSQYEAKWEDRRFRSKRSVSSYELEELVDESTKRSVAAYEVEEVVDESVEDLLHEVENVIEESEKWGHTVSLDNEGHVRLSWTIRDHQVDFKIEAPTTGYLGLGFSPKGDMEGADIVLGWVDDNTGKAFIVDCHGKSKTLAPVEDAEQNYDLLGGSQNGSHTVLRFRRALDTCDSGHDMPLGSDTVRVIWAIYRSDPSLDASGRLQGLNWHGDRRGGRSLHLIKPQAPLKTPRPGLRQWDVTLDDFTVPEKMDTYYWCKIFKIPPLERKHHVIGYEPLLSGGHTGYVHHMLLYECATAPGQERVFEKYDGHEGATCYSPEMPRDWDQCLTPIVTWAIGSEGEFLPDHVGLPLGEGKRSTYFMMEVHFDNPAFRRVSYSPGLRLFYTEHLRKYDAGIMVNGITVSPLHIIPPKQLEYKTAGYCNSQCTDKMLPDDGIKIISVVLHSHLAGKRMRLRHVRAGQELARITEDDHYDFNYQQSRVLPREVLVKRGDELITECVYQTPNRTEPTFGGYSTKQEMCLAFVLYYPRTQLAGCYSMTPVKHFFESFGVRQFYNTDMDAVERMFLKTSQNDDDRNAITTSTTTSAAPNFGDFSPASAMDPELNERAINALKNMKDYTVEVDNNGGLFGELVIKEPMEFRNKSFMSHLYEHPWDERLLTQRIEESFYTGQHMVFCRKRDDTLAIPADIFNFPNFTQLPEINNTLCREKNGQLYLNSGSAVFGSVTIIATALLSLRLT